MHENLLFRIINIFLSIVLIYTVEEFVCYLILKKQKKIELFKEYKAHNKTIFLHSQYLYKNKKYLISIKLILILFVVLFILHFNINYNYYDINGNGYKNQNDILFYDVDGNCYSIDKYSKYFIDNNNKITNKEYVDTNGNVTEINEDDLYVSSMSGISYMSNGKIYFMNTYVYWDKDKQLHYVNVNNDYKVNDYNFSVNIETGDCSVTRRGAF